MSSSEKSSTITEVTLLEITGQSQFNNRLVVKHFGNLTMQKAFESKSLCIGQIAKQDEEKAVLCISNLFKSVAIYFDVNLSQAKSEAIATELLYTYEYRSLKLEDLVVICKRLKESEIHKLTPARIIREIKQYAHEREQLAINTSLNAKGDENINAEIEKRLKKHFYNIPDNPERLATKRFDVEQKFKR